MTDHPADSNRHWMKWGMCALLAAMTLAVLSPTVQCGFINSDDGTYVYRNPVVQQGLTLKGVGWAFTHAVAGNWHPLTMLSFMADYQLHGLKPGGYHLTNVLLHTLAVILLFLVLEEMTGAPWLSAFVAAVFAIHPLRLESVAWISERKDVLSGVFFMLTLWAYLRYVRRPFSPARYFLVVLAFVLGLLSKPMLVTVPFVLLLLDCWPLNRFPIPDGPGRRFSIPWRIIFEKLPLLALSVSACVAAVLTQKSAVVLNNTPDFPVRMENALVSYVIYIRQMLYPAGLSFFYPFSPAGIASGKVLFSLAVLAIITAAAFFYRSKRPYLMVGWLWYLGMMVPVIGLVQVGLQAHADRYTYLPEIGLCLALTWLVGERLDRGRHTRWWLGGVAFLVIAGLSAGMAVQIPYWHDSESLWNHALACTADNVVARDNLGEALLQKGQMDGAVVHFRKALEIEPDNVLAHTDLAVALFQKGQINEAFDHFRKALALGPSDPLMHYNFGYALFSIGQVARAADQFRAAVQIQPDYAQDVRRLAEAALRRGQVDEALVLLQIVVNVRPADAEAHYLLGMIFLKKGEISAAVDHLRAALESQPDNSVVRNALARVLATSPDASIRDASGSTPADSNAAGRRQD